jgi:hypothetical protein
MFHDLRLPQPPGHPVHSKDEAEAEMAGNEIGHRVGKRLNDFLNSDMKPKELREKLICLMCDEETRSKHKCPQCDVNFPKVP